MYFCFNIYFLSKLVYNNIGEIMVKFGVAGGTNAFYMNHKNSYEMPEYLKSINLDAYEYQCSRGVRVSQKLAEKIKEEAHNNNILLSVHAPYYISLSTQDEVKKEKTINYIIDTMKVAKIMGADRIVVHAGALLVLDREYAIESACKLLKQALDKADSLNLGDITICPETMGKINQLGNSKEIIQLCKIDKRLIPTIDFGHLYARSIGKLNTYDLWKNELQMYIDELGFDRMKNFHAHFSHMEYTENGGEKCHVKFEDEGFGPDFINVCKALIDLKLEPRIICESAGSQDIDAIKMKEIYFNMKGN